MTAGALPSNRPDIARIGRYVVDRPLGRGGMSRTYRCTLEGVGGFRKLLLVKMLAPAHARDHAFRRMFLDEARLSAHLVHPNIAQVFEVGEEGGVPWLAMEYVAGPNLAMVSKRLRSANIRHYGHIARLMADMARGLDYAHHLSDEHGRPLGIIHRDVSLGNVVVAPTGTAKLIDFGIAWSRTKTNITEVGMLKGKLHYMAPEQLKEQVDHRVDIYQAGVCLYWLTVGRPPFHHRDPVQLWRQRLEGRLLRPTRIRADYPRELESIVARALARNPADRFQRASDLADALEAFAGRSGPWRSSSRAAGGWVRSLFSDAELEEFRTCSLELRGTDPAIDLSAVEDFGREVDSQDTLTVDPEPPSPPPAAGPAPAAATQRHTGPLAAPDDPTTPMARPPLQRRPVVRPPPAASAPIAPVPLRALVGAGALGAVVSLGLGALTLWWVAPPPPAVERNRAAAIYATEAARLLAQGESARAASLVDRAHAAHPDDLHVLERLHALDAQLVAAPR